MQKYSVNQQPIELVLADVKGGQIAIPEIQRPFVWDAAKVRDLMDSLYQGYPVGYVIAWKNPNVRLKDGSLSVGKKILIDGQQRVTALTAAILGEYVVNKTYQRVRIKIAFNPVLEKFEVQNPAILKDKTWLPDISQVMSGAVDLFEIADNYFAQNPDIDKKAVRKAFTSLVNIPKQPIGLIELASDLDIETVTEIFIRINSKGVVLSQADFAMSKIATSTQYQGHELRKAIDYFCHLAVAPEFYRHIVDNDKAFAATEIFQKMRWLKSENDDIYDPDYTDLLRVAYTSQFNRGRMADLVSLLSGRNFEARTFEDEIAGESFGKLTCGVHNFMNESNFKRFIMLIRSAGFISSKLIRSQNALNFAYILYLKLRELKINDVAIGSYVPRWFVYSILTGRYSSSPESFFDLDIRQIAEKPFAEYLQEKEQGELSDAFWNTVLPQSLDTSVASSPYFNVFLAAQVKSKDKGFLSKQVLVSDLIAHKGDVHHLFPRDYLKKHGLERGKYNQIANYVYMQSEINIKIGNKPPKDYFALIRQQIADNDLKLSGLASETEFSENLQAHCIPAEITAMSLADYPDFLALRRKQMASKIRDYYFSL